MPVDAFIHLDRLRCRSEHDHNGHSEPYVWAMLLWADDTTVGSGVFVEASAPATSQGFRAVIKDGIRAGERASMPSAQRRFAHRFEDNLERRDIGIIVAMFEEDDTPSDAARAGYRAFVRELPLAVADFIRSHLAPPVSAADREEIAAQVRPKVRAAVRDALSGFEKLQALLGNLNFDDQLGFDTFFTSVDSDEQPPSRFTLRYRKTFTETVGGQQVERINDYEIDGRFEVRRPPPPDPCQAAIDRVTRAREAADGLQTHIASLQVELSGAPPQQKAAIIAEIRRIREEDVPAAAAVLEAARRALAQCRAAQDSPILDPVAADSPAKGLPVGPSA
jgi:hypothetical protein